MSASRFSTREKRSSERFPWLLKMNGSLLSEFHRQSESTVECVTENIGRGGVQVLSSRRLVSGEVVRCVFVLSDNWASIPTLMRVRWSTTSQEANQYRAGLQFLI